jgi:hypothetical protein
MLIFLLIKKGTMSESSAYLSAILQNVRLNVYATNYCSNVGATVPKNWNAQLCVGMVVL